MEQLLARYPIISDQVDRSELEVILTELQKQLAKNSTGSVVEFGCYVGTTSLFITRMLQTSNAMYQYHVYDSFQGLPDKDMNDQSPAGIQFRKGELAAAKTAFIKNFKKSGLRMPHIHKNWFKDLSEEDIPNDIVFAFLDGDFYQSVLTPLKLIWDKLAPGAVVLIDDYHNEALPGAAKAVDEWITNHPVASFRIQSSLAILRP